MNALSKKGGTKIFWIIIALAIIIFGMLYGVSKIFTNSTQYDAAQNSQGQGNTGQATLSPLVLSSLSLATTTANTSIILSGKDFAALKKSSSASGQLYILASNTNRDSAVLWQGNPDLGDDTSISVPINRFLCDTIQTVQGTSSDSLSDVSSNISQCNNFFALIPGTYTITAQIPALGYTSNPLTLNISSPSNSSLKYINSQYGYILSYPDDLTLKTNASYPPTPGSGVNGTILTFPRSYYPYTTISTASIDIAVTNGNCDLWPDGVQSFSVVATTTSAQGIQFLGRIDTDAGAGNIYSTTEYSSVTGSGTQKCYRVSLFYHLGNPGMYSADQNIINTYSSANTAAENMMNSVLAQIIQSFVFIKK